MCRGLQWEQVHVSWAAVVTAVSGAGYGTD